MSTIETTIKKKNDEEVIINISVPSHWNTCTEEQQTAYMEKHSMRAGGTLINYAGRKLNKPTPEPKAETSPEVVDENLEKEAVPKQSEAGQDDVTNPDGSGAAIVTDCGRDSIAVAAVGDDAGKGKPKFTLKDLPKDL